MIDSYTYVIVALLPLAAFMLVFQVNPYHALVIRAILGAVAALVYGVLGAADVALTEALVGTMLAITLYVVAVRSSLVMRLGILDGSELEKEDDFAQIITKLRKVSYKYHLRLELVQYSHQEALEAALMAKDVHATCTPSINTEANSDRPYHTSIRIHRLFEILQDELTSPATTLAYITVPNTEDKH
ncbi:MAG TPA: hypothetical protein DCF68_02245 [Cyanothece sp. UBA12306]|nr:hypothetical protein [Cyanothece sp. UBA12306]